MGEWETISLDMDQERDASGPAQDQDQVSDRIPEPSMSTTNMLPARPPSLPVLGQRSLESQSRSVIDVEPLPSSLPVLGQRSLESQSRSVIDVQPLPSSLPVLGQRSLESQSRSVIDVQPLPSSLASGTSASSTPPAMQSRDVEVAKSPSPVAGANSNGVLQHIVEDQSRSMIDAEPLPFSVTGRTLDPISPAMQSRNAEVAKSSSQFAAPMEDDGFGIFERQGIDDTLNHMRFDNHHDEVLPVGPMALPFTAPTSAPEAVSLAPQPDFAGPEDRLFVGMEEAPPNWDDGEGGEQYLEGMHPVPAPDMDDRSVIDDPFEMHPVPAPDMS